MYGDFVAVDCQLRSICRFHPHWFTNGVETGVGQCVVVFDRGHYFVLASVISPPYV